VCTFPALAVTRDLTGDYRLAMWISTAHVVAALLAVLVLFLFDRQDGGRLNEARDLVEELVGSALSEELTRRKTLALIESLDASQTEEALTLIRQINSYPAVLENRANRILLAKLLRISHAELVGLISLFHQADTDGDGSLSLLEVATLLRTTESPLLRRVFAVFEGDRGLRPRQFILLSVLPQSTGIEQMKSGSVN
jgi:hypothetical protein